MSEVQPRLVRCFAAVFPELKEKEIPLASPASVGTWDSVAAITLISVIEEEFQIQIDPNDLESLTSFPLILDYLVNEKRVA